METPEHLQDDEYAEAVLDCVKESWLATDELFDGWEDDLVQKMHELSGDDVPEENDVWDMLDKMGLTCSSSPFANTLNDDDDEDQNHETFTYSKDNLF
jgi:hypothetical protein